MYLNNIYKYTLSYLLFTDCKGAGRGTCEFCNWVYSPCNRSGNLKVYHILWNTLYSKVLSLSFIYHYKTCSYHFSEKSILIFLVMNNVLWWYILCQVFHFLWWRMADIFLVRASHLWLVSHFRWLPAAGVTLIGRLWLVSHFRWSYMHFTAMHIIISVFS